MWVKQLDQDIYCNFNHRYFHLLKKISSSLHIISYCICIHEYFRFQKIIIFCNESPTLSRRGLGENKRWKLLSNFKSGFEYTCYIAKYRCQTEYKDRVVKYKCQIEYEICNNMYLRTHDLYWNTSFENSNFLNTAQFVFDYTSVLAKYTFESLHFVSTKTFSN